MVNLETLNSEILDLEKKDTTYATCERLAWLYIVKDHLTPEPKTARTGQYHGSEFLAAASGVDVEAVLRILDEHLEAVRVIYPKEYEAVIERIEALK